MQQGIKGTTNILISTKKKRICYSSMKLPGTEGVTILSCERQREYTLVLTQGRISVNSIERGRPFVGPV